MAGEGVVVVDAGGATISISLYSKNVGEAKNRFEEVAAPQYKRYLFLWTFIFQSHHCP